MPELEKIKTNFDLEKVRKDFPVLQRKVNGKPLIYFDSGATSQKPIQVIETIKNFYSNHNSNIHRGVHTLSRESTDLYEDSRSYVREYLNAKENSEIIFTAGTTDSINMVAGFLSEFHFACDDEIILTELEHHSNILPWKALEKTKGVKIKVAKINKNGEIDLDYFQSLLSEKSKLIALTHISNTLGTINPIKEIVTYAKRYNIPVLVDGAQSIPHLKIDVQELDCDFYVFSGHKVYGPTGVGVLYAQKKWLDKFSPCRHGGGIIKSVSFDSVEYADAPQKFEAGTPNIEGVIALKTALQFVKDLGLENVEQYEKSLTEYALSNLNSIQEIEVYGTPAKRSAVISFNLKGAHPFDVGTLLDKMGIAVRTGHHCTQPLMQVLGIPGTVRISFCVFNTKEEIDSFTEALMKVKKMLL